MFRNPFAPAHAPVRPYRPPLECVRFFAAGLGRLSGVSWLRSGFVCHLRPLRRNRKASTRQLPGRRSPERRHFVPVLPATRWWWWGGGHRGSGGRDNLPASGCLDEDDEARDAGWWMPPDRAKNTANDDDNDNDNDHDHDRDHDRDHDDAGGLKLTRVATCAKCKGSGKVPDPNWENGGGGYCPRCAGARFVEEDEELVLSVPAGIEAGQTEVYGGLGHVDVAGEQPMPYRLGRDASSIRLEAFKTLILALIMVDTSVISLFFSVRAPSSKTIDSISVSCPGRSALIHGQEEKQRRC